MHIASLIWGVIVEVSPLPCPLTLAESWCEARAGINPVEGGFILHYLDQIVYPNISPTLLATFGVIVCALNLAIYARRVARHR